MYDVHAFVTPSGQMNAANDQTFLFADLVGYTSLTERVGDDAAADVARAVEPHQKKGRHGEEAPFPPVGAGSGRCELRTPVIRVACPCLSSGAWR